MATSAKDYSKNRVKTGNALFDSMEIPGYEAAYNPLDMSMTGHMSGLMGTYGGGYKQFKDEAMRKGPSSWYNQSTLRGDLQEVDQREKLGRQIASENAGAMDTLAASGGLSSGARERATESGAKNYIDMSQGLQREGNINDLTLGIQDETNRIGQLGDLQGMEMGLMNTWNTAKSQDIQNALAEAERLNRYNMDLYGKQMDAAAAERQARATENSGGGGISCFITTALVEHYGMHDRCDTMETLRTFRDNYMTEDAARFEDVEQYYKLSEKYAPLLKELDSEVAWSEIKSQIDQAVAAIYRGENELAHKLYKNLVHFVVGLFPEKVEA